MASVRQLYQLQELDTEIEQRRQCLEGIEQALADPGPAAAISQNLQETKQKVRELQLSQRSRERDAQGLREKPVPLQTERWRM